MSGSRRLNPALVQEYKQDQAARKEHEYRTCMKMLAGAYPEKALDENVIIAYREGLSDCEEGYLYLAIKDIIKEAKFFPRISEILERYQQKWHGAGRRPLTWDGEAIERLTKIHGRDGVNKQPDYDSAAYHKRIEAYWERVRQHEQS